MGWDGVLSCLVVLNVVEIFQRLYFPSLAAQVAMESEQEYSLQGHFRETDRISNRLSGNDHWL